MLVFFYLFKCYLSSNFQSLERIGTEDFRNNKKRTSRYAMSHISPDDALMDVVTRLVVKTARSKSHSERHSNKVS